jgi:hypothetical protein
VESSLICEALTRARERGSAHTTQHKYRDVYHFLITCRVSCTTVTITLKTKNSRRSLCSQKRTKIEARRRGVCEEICRASEQHDFADNADQLLIAEWYLELHSITFVVWQCCCCDNQLERHHKSVGNACARFVTPRRSSRAHCSHLIKLLIFAMTKWTTVRDE